MIKSCRFTTYNNLFTVKAATIETITADKMQLRVKLQHGRNSQVGLTVVKNSDCGELGC